MRLRWSTEPNETGLARVCQGPRGAILKVDGEEIGRASFSRVYDGWYWNAYSGIQRTIQRRYGHGISTLEAAKDECEAYVRSELGLPAKAKKKARAKP